MFVCAVGRPYAKSLTLPMPETPHLWITGSSMELAVSYRNLGPEEVDAYQHGDLRLRWIDSRHAGILAFKFGDLEWADCPFHPRLIIGAGMTPPRLAPKSDRLLPVILIEGTTGIVRAIRAVGLSEQFVTAMAATVSRLLRPPYDSIAAHDRALNTLYTRYRTPADLVLNLGGDGMYFSATVAN